MKIDKTYSGNVAFCYINLVKKRYTYYEAGLLWVDYKKVGEWR